MFHKKIEETNANFLQILLLLSLIYLGFVFLWKMIPNSEESQFILWELFFSISFFAAWSYTVVGGHMWNGGVNLKDFHLLRADLKRLKGLKGDYLLALVPMYEAPMVQNTKTIRELAIEANRSFSEGTVFVAGSKKDKAIEEFFALKRVFRKHCPNESIKFKLYPQLGKGKRKGMLPGLDAIKNLADSLALCFPNKEIIGLLMDGDTILTEGIFEKTVPFLVDKSLNYGALTVDNIAHSTGGGLFYILWNNLRFLRRNLYLNSAVTVLTGRFALIRGDVLRDQRFIDLISDDSINHWMFGVIKLLTADDKSSRYYFHEIGLKVAYIPDVHVICQEEIPISDDVKYFKQLNGIHSVSSRMKGNMFRALLRCLKQGPKKVGWGLWLTYLDQQIGFWRPLIGPFSAFWLWTMYGDGVLALYLLISIGWRCFYIAYQKLIRDYYRTLGLLELLRQVLLVPIEAVLLYLDQTLGALVATHRFWYLDIQFWSRVDSKIGTLTVVDDYLRIIGFYGTLGVLFFGTGALTGAL